MNSFLIGVGIVSVLVIIAVVSVAIGFVVLRNKLNRFSRDLFGSGDFVDNIKKQKQLISETPKSIRSMTSIYQPLIKKDFPDFDYEHYRTKAQSVLRSYFNAIAGKSPSLLQEECSLTLINNVSGIIEDFNSRNATQYFDQAVMHDTQITRYIKDGKTVTIVFEISVGYLAYTKDGSGRIIFGSNTEKQQTIYEIGLVYIQDEEMLSNMGEAFGIHCPNCGAPITNLGSKFCEYCGSAVTEVNTRAWKFNSVREQSFQRKQY